MKINILNKLLLAVMMLVAFAACQEPYQFAPSQYAEQFDSFTASFFDDDRDENSFAAEIDYDAHTITIVFPYNYPQTSENILTDLDIEHVRVTCNLKTGLVLSPALTWMDLSKDNYITVSDQDGNKTRYLVTGEIRKSAECVITDFSIPELGLEGVIDPTALTITLVSADAIGEQIAEVYISHGATISPDPRTTALNYDNEPEITVTAQNGVDKNIYKVIKGTPTCLPAGMRDGSEKLLWTKKLSELGIAVHSSADWSSALKYQGATGLAVDGNYLIINDGQMGTAPYLNYKTGAVIGSIDLTATGKGSDGYYNNYRMTSDKSGNILVCSSSNLNSGTFTIWRQKGVNGSLEKYITCSSSYQVGNQLSVAGSLDGNAVITASLNGTSVDFLRWTVVNGVLQSQTPTSVHMTGFSGTCWGNFDVVYADGAKPQGEYLAAGYVAFTTTPPNASGSNNRTCVLFDSSNTIKSYGSVCISSNWVENQADVCDFNNSKYFVHNSVNTFTWGSDDSIYMYDITAGDLSTSALDFSDSGLCINRNYGATAAGNLGIASNHNDVMLYPSTDGFFMYLFFQFTNGSVGCVRVDCIDM